MLLLLIYTIDMTLVTLLDIIGRLDCLVPSPLTQTRRCFSAHPIKGLIIAISRRVSAPSNCALPPGTAIFLFYTMPNRRRCQPRRGQTRDMATAASAGTAPYSKLRRGANTHGAIKELGMSLCCQEEDVSGLQIALRARSL